MNRNPLNWEDLVNRVSATPEPEPRTAPPDLARRVLAVWHTLRRDEQLRRWTRWAARGVVASAVVCAIAFAFRREDDAPILLPPPPAPMPTPRISTPAP